MFCLRYVYVYNLYKQNTSLDNDNPFYLKFKLHNNYVY